MRSSLAEDATIQRNNQLTAGTSAVHPFPLSTMGFPEDIDTTPSGSTVQSMEHRASVSKVHPDI